MYIVYVKHYLEPMGLEYFHTVWFPKVKALMREQPGFVNVVHDAQRDSDDCVNIVVTFENKESLSLWAEHPEHDAFINLLDIYRSRQYWEYASTEGEIDRALLKWEQIEPISF